MALGLTPRRVSSGRVAGSDPDAMPDRAVSSGLTPGRLPPTCLLYPTRLRCLHPFSIVELSHGCPTLAVRAAATRAVAAANTSDLARYTRARDIEAAQRELTAEP